MEVEAENLGVRDANGSGLWLGCGLMRTEADSGPKTDSGLAKASKVMSCVMAYGCDSLAGTSGLVVLSDAVKSSVGEGGARAEKGGPGVSSVVCAVFSKSVVVVGS